MLYFRLRTDNLHSEKKPSQGCVDEEKDEK